MAGFLTRSGNQLQNPSFESGLSFWQADNVITSDLSPAEGTQAASLGPGVASLYQDVPIPLWQRKPLLLNFIAYAQTVGPGDLTVEVNWLNAFGAVIGTGLRAFVQSINISNVRITFFDVTDRPPAGAVMARLLFSKDTGGIPLLLDLVNLVPVETPNLVRNGSFERGLVEWSANGFSVSPEAWEGGAAARQLGSNPGTLTQDIPLNPFLPGAAYLLSFAVQSPLPSTLTIELIWRNALGNPIGSPGISVAIVPPALDVQDKYLSYVLLSGPAPLGAVQARLVITAVGAADSTLDLDQVILVRLLSPNLLQNPGFSSGLDDWTEQNVVPRNTGGYVGQNFAELSSNVALIHQTVSLPLLSACHCFQLSFALRYSGINGNGNVFAQVHWLDLLGNDLGLGLALIISQPVQAAAQWQVYTGITEQVPPGAVSAIIQFSKSPGSAGTVIGLDSVSFARVN